MARKEKNRMENVLGKSEKCFNKGISFNHTYRRDSVLLRLFCNKKFFMDIFLGSLIVNCKKTKLHDYAAQSI